MGHAFDVLKTRMGALTSLATSRRRQLRSSSLFRRISTRVARKADAVPSRREVHFSVATAIGFIALAGVAAETGVVMLIYLDHAYRERLAVGEIRNEEDIDAAVHYGAVDRVRPKLMTVTAIIAGLLPILWSHGTGADVMKRIAAPMVGGMITSTILTLLVIPAIYSLWKQRLLHSKPAIVDKAILSDVHEHAV